ncbi:MAG: Maebl, partial [Candidatus Aminicenantes bacterium]|nr:Maebl [Candidatus Aminicenantes bacterium]
KKKTPKAFVNACNIFIYTENLAPRPSSPKPRGTARVPQPKEERPRELDPLPLLKGAFDMAVQEDGWADLATMGFYLHQLDPSFDPRTYGFKQLSQLIKSYSNAFESKFREESGTTKVFVRSKE